MPVIPVKIFQSTEVSSAGAFVHGAVAKGELAAAFVYSDTITESGEAWGHLHVYMPTSFGFTLRGHEAIKAKYIISEFKQKERIVLWIKDTMLEEAVKTVNDAIAKEK